LSWASEENVKIGCAEKWQEQQAVQAVQASQSQVARCTRIVAAATKTAILDTGRYAGPALENTD